MSNTYIPWASQAPTGNVVSPSVEKQAAGWVAEIPTFENFNWYMNRTDTRLASLEEPWEFAEVVSVNRASTLAAGSSFTVPQYIVGSRQLQISLDGLPCRAGSGGTYSEVGEAGNASNAILWNDAITPELEIRAWAPVRATAGIGGYYGVVPYAIADGEQLPLTMDSPNSIKLSVAGTCEVTATRAMVGYNKTVQMCLYATAAATVTLHYAVDIDPTMTRILSMQAGDRALVNAMFVDGQVFFELVAELAA